ncbi:4-oxalomesaconate tautomerase [Muricoccus radiodurans]|uniref:4-oxalomesaconate tautomerase n=1 Tax=Muricoccus radiodurans TaxID=2231721 RepID=UPI003CF9E08A
MQTRIPCVMMRGGTSRGPYFLATDLPEDPATRDAVLLAAMGSPHRLQVDGIGGGDTLTSKVAIVSRSTEPGVDVNYLFAQVSVDKAIVDTRPNCGNMLSGVGPFAVEAGIVPARDGTTPVVIRNQNTGALVEAVVQTPGGEVTYEGEASIPGVAGTAAPVILKFRDIMGGKCGALFPTGNVADEIQGVRATLIDCAMPVMIVEAAALGASALSPPAEIEADPVLMARIESLRVEAGMRMNLGDVRDSVIPKPVLVGPSPEAADLAARYLTPHAVHKAMAVTGGIAIAVASRTPGTVAHAVTTVHTADDTARIAHPSGVIEIALGMKENGVEWAGVLRTARRIFEGNLLVPARIWSGHQAAPLAAAAE